MSTKENKYGHAVADKIYFIKCLNELGLTKQYIGFYYMVLILDLLINGNVADKSFCKNVYPIVAKTYNKSACTVERDIRILIEKCDKTKLAKKLNFASKITCCKFIRLINKYILNSLG